MKNNPLLKGTAWITGALLITKILGFIYVIPFTSMVGTEGYILYEYAYKPYAIMISLATLGIPMAVSKFVSKYNELGDYRIGLKLLKSGLVIMTFFGVVWFLILYHASPTIADWLVNGDNETGNNIDDIVFVLRMVSFALIIVPPMALLRGFLQGYQKMKPTAVSQVIEQLTRIIIILGVAVVFIYVLEKRNISLIVGVSTFAAAIAAIFSCLVLIHYLKKLHKEYQFIWKKKSTSSNSSIGKIYKEIFKYSIPFVVVSLGISIYQNIDLFSINPTLMEKGYTQAEAEYVNSIVSLTQKVVTIPIVLANAFALTLVPTITKNFYQNDVKSTHKNIHQSFQTILFITLPINVFFFVFSEEVFGVMLGTQHASLGGQVTKSFAFISLFFSFYVITSSIMQGINKQFYSIVSLILGIFIKLLTVVPLLKWTEQYGAALSTMLGFSVTIFINFIVIKHYAKYSFRSLFKESLQLLWVLLLSTLVLLIIYDVFTVLELNLSLYAQYFLKVLIAGVIFVGLYLFLSVKRKLFQRIFQTKKLAN